MSDHKYVFNCLYNDPVISLEFCMAGLSWLIPGETCILMTREVVTYNAFGKSLCTYKRCWIRFSWSIVSKNLIKQLHALLVLLFNNWIQWKKQLTSTATSILKTKSTYRSLSVQRLSERTVLQMVYYCWSTVQPVASNYNSYSILPACTCQVQPLNQDSLTAFVKVLLVAFWPHEFLVIDFK
jgi:hypothetical protein